MRDFLLILRNEMTEVADVKSVRECLTGMGDG